MKNFCFLSFLLGCISLISVSSCTLEKEPEIPAGITNENAPVFISTNLERVTKNGVKSKALLNSLGNLSISRHGWTWSKNPTPTLHDNILESGILEDYSFETTISDLILAKTYYIRPFLITPSDTLYGLENTIILDTTFEKIISGANANGYSMQKTADGGFILVGTIFLNSLESRIYLVKINALGIVQWARSVGTELGVKECYGHSVQQTTDGGFIILGDVRNEFNGSLDIYLVKTNSSGFAEWGKSLGSQSNDNGFSVIQITDGGFIFSGNRDGFLFIEKRNASGNFEWIHFLQNMIYSYGYSVQQTADGGFIILGDSNIDGISDLDMTLLKTNANGNIEWWRTFGGISDEDGRALQITEDGGYILVGTTQSKGHGGKDMYLVKTNSSGLLQWDNTFGTPGDESGWSVQQTTDGGFIVVGSIGSDMYLVKTDESGILQWENNLGKSGDDQGRSVLQSLDGFILLGTTTNMNESRMYLVKTDRYGKVY